MKRMAQCLIWMAGIGLLMAKSTTSSAMEVTLATDGQAAAVIVVSETPSPAANLAALELQHHVALISGARLTIQTPGEKAEGARLLVGQSAATRALDLRSQDFGPQEYLIRFLPNTIVLLGRDWEDTPENRHEPGRGTNWQTTLAQWRQDVDYAAATGQEGGAKPITLPGLFDDQGTCYAAYDFLERFCGVRWYGPSPVNVVHRASSALTVTGHEIRRSPAMKYREGIGGGWPIVKAQWDDPTPDQLNLYWRRLRLGGEKWGGNHSFMSFQDRFLRKNPERPELFEEAHPEFFAQGREGGPGERQFCYTNPGLIRQVAQDARDFFDGRGLKGFQVAMGDYFAVVPLDNARWCTCDACQAALKRDGRNRRGGHFSSGTASHYLFGFVNAVAKEVAKTHSDKYIATLAYHVYAYPPEDFELEPNVAVAPCLQTRNYWAPKIKANDLFFYKQWVKQDRPIHVWNYYCFPMEPALGQGWHCFPGFSAHTHAEHIKMYHQDGVRGVFLCGIGEQVDYYLTMKLYDDATLDPDAVLDEFFSRYFGSAAKPMAAFYALIEQTFNDPANYPEEVREKDRQYHQNERTAWEWLGTEERMEQLGALMGQAEALAATEIERRRVDTWKRGVWDYMVEGRRKYFENASAE